MNFFNFFGESEKLLRMAWYLFFPWRFWKKKAKKKKKWRASGSQKYDTRPRSSFFLFFYYGYRSKGGECRSRKGTQEEDFSMAQRGKVPKFLMESAWCWLYINSARIKKKEKGNNLFHYFFFIDVFFFCLKNFRSQFKKRNFWMIKKKAV